MRHALWFRRPNLQKRLVESFEAGAGGLVANLGDDGGRRVEGGGFGEEGGERGVVEEERGGVEDNGVDGFEGWRGSWDVFGHRGVIVCVSVGFYRALNWVQYS